MSHVEKSKALVRWGVVLLILSVVLAGIGYNKYTVYEAASSGGFEGTAYKSYSSGKNAYVGGDAYNYIINGTYFTAFAALSGACLLAAIILFGFSSMQNVQIELQGELLGALDQKQKEILNAVEKDTPTQ